MPESPKTCTNRILLVSIPAMFSKRFVQVSTSTFYMLFEKPLRTDVPFLVSLSVALRSSDKGG